MKSQATSVAAYLDELSDDRRLALNTLLDLIRTAAPDAVEDIQYGMPTFSLGAMLFALASQKGHMSLYVTDADVVNTHRPRLGKLNCGKGCIRFKRLSDLPLDAISDILHDSTSRRLSGTTGTAGACS